MVNEFVNTPVPALLRPGEVQKQQEAKSTLKHFRLSLNCTLLPGRAIRTAEG